MNIPHPMPEKYEEICDHYNNISSSIGNSIWNRMNSNRNGQLSFVYDPLPIHLKRKHFFK